MRPSRLGSRLRWSVAIKAVVALILGEAAVVLGSWWVERASLKAAEKGFTAIPEFIPPPRPRIDMRGVIRPPTATADAAELADEEPVIGVLAEGRARAYTIRALSDRHQHVVNDVLGGVSLSVTYCDLRQCVRVYHLAGAAQPLEVSQGGFRDDGGMVLKIKGFYYFQQSGAPVEPGPDSPPLPYAEYPWTRTTWKEWRRQHPQTEVYTGESGRPLSSRE